MNRVSNPDSPMMLARMGGLLYLAIIGIGVFGEAIVRGGVSVPGDMSATAENIQQSISLWRLSLALELILILCATGLVYVFYTLLKRVNKDLAIAVVIFNIVAIGIEAANRFNLFSVLILLENASYLQAMGKQALYAEVQFALESYTYGFGASLVVFGVECMMLGYLIFKSRFIPKVIGILMAVAGACYVTNTFVLILSPGLADMLFPYILMPCLVAELSFALWLAVKGVDVKRWHDAELSLTKGYETRLRRFTV